MDPKIGQKIELRRILIISEALLRDLGVRYAYDWSPDAPYTFLKFGESGGLRSEGTRRFYKMFEGLR